MKQRPEARHIQLSIRVYNLIKPLNQGVLSQNIRTQVIRTSISETLKYGEASSIIHNRPIHRIS